MSDLEWIVLASWFIGVAIAAIRGSTSTEMSCPLVICGSYVTNNKTN